MKEDKKQNTSIIYVVSTVVIALGIGFFGGMKYAQISAFNVRNNSRQGIGTFAGNRMMNGGVTNGSGNRMGFRPVTGEVISSDAASITVKLPDGSSKIVIVNDKTQINKADVATKADVIVGTKVAVFGTENQDGSVTAQSVQINPVMRVETTPTQNK